MNENEKLILCAEKCIDQFLAQLKIFVELESPSYENKEASDRCGQFLFDIFDELGFEMEKLKREECGDHIYGEYGTGDKGILLVGHYDTVFPIGTVQSKMPYAVEGGKIFGSGVLDMKGGIMMGYFAIKILTELKRLPSKKIGVFFNSDEESGSVYSSEAIVKKAKEYEHVFVLEPGGTEKATVKMKRAGRATYRFTRLFVAGEKIGKRSADVNSNLVAHFDFLQFLCLIGLSIFVFLQIQILNHKDASDSVHR